MTTLTPVAEHLDSVRAEFLRTSCGQSADSTGKVGAKTWSALDHVTQKVDA